jgi:hypothetical protein
LNIGPDFGSGKTRRQMNAMFFLLLAGLLLMSLCDASANEMITKPPMPEIHQPLQVPLKIEPARKVMEVDTARPVKPETPQPTQTMPKAEPVVTPAVPEIAKPTKADKQEEAPVPPIPQLAPNLAEPTGEDAERLLIGRARVKEIWLYAQQVSIDSQLKHGDTEWIIQSHMKNMLADMPFGADMMSKNDDLAVVPIVNVNREQMKPVQRLIVQQERESKAAEVIEADENREWETIYDIRKPPME